MYQLQQLVQKNSWLFPLQDCSRTVTAPHCGNVSMLSSAEVREKPREGTVNALQSSVLVLFWNLKTMGFLGFRKHGWVQVTCCLNCQMDSPWWLWRFHSQRYSMRKEQLTWGNFFISLEAMSTQNVSEDSFQIVTVWKQPRITSEKARKIWEKN